MVTTFKLLPERVQGGKMGLMLIEKVKKKQQHKKPGKGKLHLLHNFF